jgi:hypothetical protein
LIAGEQQCGAARPVAFDFDAFVVMNGGPWIQYLGWPEPNDPLERLLGIAVLPKCRASTVGGALAVTDWRRPLRHPSHPRAWGWRAVQSELGDGIS